MDVGFILQRLAPGAQVTHSAALVGGVSADVRAVSFTLSDGSADRVVLRRHRDRDGEPDRRDRAAREHALLGVLHARGLPVPRPRMFVPPATLVLDFIEGDTVLPDDPVEALAATLAGIHAIGAEPSLPALPVADAAAAVPEVHRHLQDACGVYAGTPRLLHGDYWPGNVMWRAGRLVAVLDWEDAALGDPLFDVACARLELCCARDMATAERFTAAYARHAETAAAMPRLPWWDLHVATAAQQSMDAWGLTADALAARKAATAAFQARALARLGIA
jgi:aminoglycoside phosphotransferase (APT) family kinase protein